MNEKSYIFNLETTKIELHFDKSEYESLTDYQKTALKSAFLFSGRSQCWVSRAKEPNLWRAKMVAKDLGFVKEERSGTRISYAEQMINRTERAEDRAERFENLAQNAAARAEGLQKDFNDMRGDISFFTQPILSGHSGSQSFANRRQKIFDRYEKGFAEYRKSAYFRSRAETSNNTASNAKLADKGYLSRQIKTCQSEIRARTKNLSHYDDIMVQIESGKGYKRFDGSPVTKETVEEWMEHELELIEVAQDKEGFFQNRLDDLGGVTFSKENVHIGDIVRVRGDIAEVVGQGRENITYVVNTGGSAFCLKAAYSEIQSVEIPANVSTLPKMKIQEEELER